MPKPMFQSSNDENDKKTDDKSKSSAIDVNVKPKTLQFGDAIAHGLPESWSLVPPIVHVIHQPKN